MCLTRRKRKAWMHMFLLSLSITLKHRVHMCLANPWISGVQFQGLESTWNWFLVLESPQFFYWTRSKNRMLLRQVKASENKCSGEQGITFSMLTKCVKTCLFCSHCSLSLLLHMYMYVELQVHSTCLVSTCFQALVFWRFLCVFGGLAEFYNARPVSFNSNILCGLR